MPNLKQAMMGAAGVSSGGSGVEESLFTWGMNSGGGSAGGFLMLGDLTNRSSPVQVGSLTDWAFPGAGYYSTAVVKGDGTLWVAGFGSYGLLGTGNTTHISSPVQVGALNDWFEVFPGDYNMCAIKTDGTAWSWGYGSSGSLGDGTNVSKSSPVQIGSLTDWNGNDFDNLVAGVNKLGVQRYTTNVIKDDGTLWGWGTNSSGQIGDGTNVAKSSPVQIGSLTTWRNLGFSCGYNGVATRTDGTLWVWGAGGSGNNGQGNTTTYSSPVQIGSATDWASGGSGNNFVHAIKTNGTLWGWGINSYGQLGTDTSFDSRSSPVQIGSLTDWKLVLNGYETSRFVKTDGTLWMSGRNDQGQLGNGNTTNVTSPIQVGSATDWGYIMGGYKHTAATRDI